MGRVVAVVLCVLAAAVVVMAKRVQEVPPGIASLASADLTDPSCHKAALTAYKTLTKDWTADPNFLIYKTDAKDFKNYAFTDPGKSLCNGKDRVIFLSMSIAPRNMALVTHHALLHTYGGGKYAVLYESFSADAHKEAQGKSYRMDHYIAALQTYLKSGKDGDIANMPPVLKELPCECQDMANWLQALLDSTTASFIKSEYNRLFTPQNDKASARPGLTTFWGSVWQEKDYFQLYKFAEGVPANGLPTSAFIEAAAVHHTAQRVKTPAALLDLKRARKQHPQQRARQQHLIPANVLVRQH